jgi:hypothetical protein
MVGFLVAFIVINRFVRLICIFCTDYWPISVFVFRTPPRFYYPNLGHILVAILTIAIFAFSLIALAKTRYKLLYVIGFGIVLILGSNLTQGVQHGLITPIEGYGDLRNEYFNDAIEIVDPLKFLSNYIDVQPNLLLHSRTHPPGAVLLFYYLSKVLVKPAIISIFITVISVLVHAYYLWKLFYNELKDEALAGYATFLFLLLPAIQIYFTASIDALIAAFLLGVVYQFIHSERNSGLLVATLLLLLASFMSFGSLFIVPVIFVYEFLDTRSIRKSLYVTAAIGMSYLLLFSTTGFNYAQSFFLAAKLENPYGPWLLARPASYIATRLEGLFELVLFYGPFLGIITMWGLGENMARSKLKKITSVGVACLALMLLLGVFRTGETARAAIFIYPYLIFPMGIYLKDHPISLNQRNVLAAMVFMHTMIMQMVGNYFW